MKEGLADGFAGTYCGVALAVDYSTRTVKVTCPPSGGGSIYAIGGVHARITKGLYR